MSTSRLMHRSAILNVMTTAVYKAARSLVRDFNEIEHLQVSKKGLGDFVSTADHRAEKILIQELSKARPDYSFLLEETGAIEGKDPHHRWIVDPLDGTTNFLHGIPHFAISVALQKGKQIVAGMIYNPITDELYWAEKGDGAYLNKRRLRVSGRRHLDEALVATGIPYGNTGDRKKFLSAAERVMPRIAGLRRFGAAALDLAFVAAGRYDAYFEEDICPWDVAAGMLMVREAGGRVTELNGGDNILESGSIYASNMALYDPLKKLLE